MTFDEYFYASFPSLATDNVNEDLRVAFRQLAREYFDPQHSQTKDIIDRFIKSTSAFDFSFRNDFHLLLKSAAAFYLNTHYNDSPQFRESPSIAARVEALVAEHSATFTRIESQLLQRYLSFAAPPVGQRRPRVVFIGGGGGAGKSTALPELMRRGRIPAMNSVPGVVYINHDDLMAEHPLFEQVVAAGSFAAANLLHADSQRIGERLFVDALQRGSDIVYEGTMASRSATLRKMALAHKHGYDTSLLGLTVELGIALRRCLLRALETRRYVPPLQLKTHHRDFSDNFARYCDAVDECWLYQSSGGQLRTIAHGSRQQNSTTILLPSLYDKFIAKRFVNVRADHVFELYDLNSVDSQSSPVDDDDIEHVDRVQGYQWPVETPQTAAKWRDILVVMQRSARRALTTDGRCAATKRSMLSYARVEAQLAWFGTSAQEMLCFCLDDDFVKMNRL